MTQVSRAQFTICHFSLEAKHYSFSLISSVILLFRHTCILILFFFKETYFVCVCVWVCAGPSEARRGCWFAWSWSYRLCEPPDLGAGSWTQFLWMGGKYSNCWAVSPTPSKYLQREASKLQKGEPLRGALAQWRSPCLGSVSALGGWEVESGAVRRGLSPCLLRLWGLILDKDLGLVLGEGH